MDAKTKHQQILLVSEAIEKFRNIHGPRWVKLSEEELATHKEWQYILHFRKDRKLRQYKEYKQRKHPKVYQWCSYDLLTKEFSTAYSFKDLVEGTRIVKGTNARALASYFYGNLSTIVNIGSVYISRFRIKGKRKGSESFDFCKLVLKKDEQSIEAFIKGMTC